MKKLWILMCLIFVYTGAQAQNFGRISRVHPITEKRTYTLMEAAQPAVATYQPIRMRSTFLYSQNAPSTPSASGTVTPPRPHAGIRRVYDPGVSQEDGEGNYWEEEEEAWLPIPGESHYYGERKEEGGVVHLERKRMGDGYHDAYGVYAGRRYAVGVDAVCSAYLYVGCKI